jgi:hypothetical protein
MPHECASGSIGGVAGSARDQAALLPLAPGVYRFTDATPAAGWPLAPHCPPVKVAG